MANYNDFYVTLNSKSSLEYFPLNKSNNFSNHLCKPLDLPSGMYEVGLSEVVYQQQTEPQKTALPTPTKFFGNSKDDDKITLPHITWSKFRVSNKEATLNGQLAAINDKLNADKVYAVFTQLIQKGGGARKINLKFTDSYNHNLVIPQELAKVLGYNKVEFPPGEHLAPNNIDQKAYNNIPKTTSFEFKIYRWIEESLTMKEPSKYDLQGLNYAITGAIYDTIYKIQLETKANILKVHIMQDGLKMKLPSQINRYLGLEEQFIFTQKQTEIIIPDSVVQNVDQKSMFTFVSCDLIENQLIGGTSLPLLRMIPRNTENSNRFEHYRFDSVYYMTPRQQHVSQIGIKLLDDEFNYIRPYKYPTTVVLHFKRKNGYEKNCVQQKTAMFSRQNAACYLCP